MKHHARRIGGLIPRLVNAADDELPLSGIDVSLNEHNVAQVEIIAARDIDTDDAGIALPFESFELFAFDNELGINIEKRFGVHRQTSKKLVFIDIDAGKPTRVSDFVDAAHLSNAVSICQRQRKNE